MVILTHHLCSIAHIVYLIGAKPINLIKVIKMRYAQSEYAVKGTKESLRKAIEAENVIAETVFYPDGRLFDVNNDIRVDHAKKTGGNLWS